MIRILLLIIFFINISTSFANETINNVTLPALKNYADRFIYLDKVKQKICNFYELNPDVDTFINDLPILEEEKRNLASVGFKILPLTPKQVFDRNVLILEKATIINVFFFDALQNYVEIVERPTLEMVEPYQGVVQKKIFEFSNYQLSTIKQIIADYLPKRNIADNKIRKEIPAFSEKSRLKEVKKEIEFEDLTIILLGFSSGGPLANLAALNLNQYYPTMVENQKLKIITFGSHLAFCDDLSAFYDERLKNVSFNLIHENDPGLSFTPIDDALFKQVGTYILTPDPRQHHHELQGYRESLGSMRNSNYKIFEP